MAVPLADYSMRGGGNLAESIAFNIMRGGKKRKSKSKKRRSKSLKIKKSKSKKRKSKSKKRKSKSKKRK